MIMVAPFYGPWWTPWVPIVFQSVQDDKLQTWSQERNGEQAEPSLRVSPRSNPGRRLTADTTWGVWKLHIAFMWRTSTKITPGKPERLPMLEKTHKDHPEPARDAEKLVEEHNLICLRNFLTNEHGVWHAFGEYRRNLLYESFDAATLADGLPRARSNS